MFAGWEDWDTLLLPHRPHLPRSGSRFWHAEGAKWAEIGWGAGQEVHGAWGLEKYMLWLWNGQTGAPHCSLTDHIFPVQAADSTTDGGGIRG